MRLEEFTDSGQHNELTHLEIGSGGTATRVRKAMEEGISTAIGTDISLEDPYTHKEEAQRLNRLSDSELLDATTYTREQVAKVAAMDLPEINPDLVVQANVMDVLEVIPSNQLQIIWMDLLLHQMFPTENSESPQERQAKTKESMALFSQEILRTLAPTGRIVLSQFKNATRGYDFDYTEILEDQGFEILPNEAEDHLLETPSFIRNEVYEDDTLEMPLTVFRKKP